MPTIPLLIPAANPGALTGRGNNTYLIDDVLIDAGVGVPAHVDAIAAALSGRALRRLIVTHGHSDHRAGAPALVARWPGLECSMAFPDTEPTAGWTSLADGDVVSAGTASLAVIATPGHAREHVCFFDRSTGDLFAGDMVIAGTTVLVPPRAHGGSMRDYLLSLAQLRDLDAARILPGHGPVIDRARERITAIIDHRLEREAQVAECVLAGVTSPAAIVARIYEGLPPALLPFAEQTVIAHLEKLDEDRQAG